MDQFVSHSKQVNFLEKIRENITYLSITAVYFPEKIFCSKIRNCEISDKKNKADSRIIVISPF